MFPSAVSIGAAVLQVLDVASIPVALVDLAPALETRMGGGITTTARTVGVELSKLKRRGLVSWEAAPGRKPRDNRGARWSLTTEGKLTARDHRAKWRGLLGEAMVREEVT